MIGVPTLPGVIFRPLALNRDARALSQLRAACASADHIDPLSTLEGLPTPEDIYDDLAPYDAADTLIAEAEGHVVGYNRVVWWHETVSAWVFQNGGRVHPAYRGRGIGTALLTWSEARIHAIAPAIVGETGWVYGANASTTESGAMYLLQEHGYDIAFSFVHMQCASSISTRPMSIEGIAIHPPRSDDASALVALEAAVWSDRPMSPAAVTEASADLYQRIVSGDAACWRVACDGDQLVGQVRTSIRKIKAITHGIIDEIHVSSAYRRRGIARALLTQAIAALAAQGCTEIRLHTDADNASGARSLYETLGFQALKTFHRYRKPGSQRR